jgi:putative peptidoglycan binding protein
MPTDHVVEAGEHIAGIAHQHGFLNWQTIWDDPANAALKAKRSSPAVLAPGDRLVIPDPPTQTVTVATGKRHVFRISKPKLKVRVVVRDFDGSPIAKAACKLVVDDVSKELTTDDKGLIECPVSEKAKTATLTLTEPGTGLDIVLNLQIGGLDPVETLSGQEARLNNLGYAAGTAGDAKDAAFVRAVRAFQTDNKLDVDGDCGPKTQAKLTEVHGS